MCEQWEIQESSGMSKLFLSKYDLLHLVTHENYSYVKHIVYFRSKKTYHIINFNKTYIEICF
jgi:hypothetical protein